MLQSHDFGLTEMHAVATPPTLGRVGFEVIPMILAGLSQASFVACGAGALIDPPAPEIVGVRADNGQVNLDYTVWVYCTVYNDGGAGQIEVSATLEDGTGFWKKRSTMELGSEEEREHTFTFREIEFSLAGTYEYTCQAIPR